MTKTTALTLLTALASGLTLAPSVLLASDDSPRALCQQQINDYEIPPEQAGDYLRDCIASLGGEDQGYSSDPEPMPQDMQEPVIEEMQEPVLAEETPDFVAPPDDGQPNYYENTMVSDDQAAGSNGER